MATKHVTLATVADGEFVPLDEAAQSETAPPPWRWWWLAVLGASIMAWAPVICAGLLLAGWHF